MKFRKPMRAVALLPSDVETTDDNIFTALKKLHYPKAVTLKMDGIRAFKFDDLISRTLKKIPNKKIRDRANLLLPRGADVELWNKELSYHEIESIVMSHEHPAWEHIHFHLLDMVLLAMDDGKTLNYAERMNHIGTFMKCVNTDSAVKFAPPIVCHNAEQLMQFFLVVEEECGEGVCFRSLNGPYKQGKCTLKEEYLIKLCRHSIEEAEIIDFIEQYENGNPDKRNATGAMNRSKAQGNLYGKDTLGALIVRSAAGQVFRIGTGVGLDDKLRKEIWLNQEKYKGQWVKYKCKKHGEKNKPRSPVFWGFRKMEIDG